MHTDQFGRVHRYSPPAGFVQREGTTSLGTAEWTALVERGLHFEPNANLIPLYAEEARKRQHQGRPAAGKELSPGRDQVTDGRAAHHAAKLVGVGATTTNATRNILVYGTCLNPLVVAGDVFTVRDVGEDELLVDGALYVIRWHDEGQVARYRERIHAPADEPILIAKFLRWFAGQWWCQAADGVSRLNGEVLSQVVGLTRSGTHGATTTGTPAHTATIDDNATTSIANASVAGPISVLDSTSPFTYILLASISLPGFPTDNTHVLTATGVAVMQMPNLNTEVSVTYTLTNVAPTTGTASPVFEVVGNISASDTAQHAASFAFEQYFTVPANTAAAYYLWGVCADPGASGSPTPLGQVKAINFKVEIIKR
jgi:hypothetical protein